MEGETCLIVEVQPFLWLCCLGFLGGGSDMMSSSSLEDSSKLVKSSSESSSLSSGCALLLLLSRETSKIGGFSFCGTRSRSAQVGGQTI